MSKTINGVSVDDTFAEAFGMSGTGIIITADTLKWANIAATVATGFGTSVIGCGAECGIDRELSPDETPDGRPGVRILMFGFSPDALAPQIKNRIGQCVLTSPGSGCYSGLDAPMQIGLGKAPRFFGDGFQTAKRLGDSRYWRVPVMDGEFIVEETCGVTTDAVGGGNLLIVGNDRAGLLQTAEEAVAAIAKVDDVITPFPGGIVRSGSKVGAKYAGMFASTNDAFWPCAARHRQKRARTGQPRRAGDRHRRPHLQSRRRRHACGTQSDHRCRRETWRHPRDRRQLRRQTRPAPLSLEGSDLMSGLTLRLKAPATERLNLTGVTPAKLAALSRYEMANLTVGIDKTPLTLGDAFDISGTPGEDLTIEGATDAQIDFLGAELDGGTIRLIGNAGSYVGRKMTGGKIEIRGNAGDYLASRMTGGMIHVAGNAGDHLGGVLAGDRFGMLGGIAVIEGDVGVRAGEKMRRGTVIVRGKTAEGAGTRMIGGTIWAEGGFGPAPGLMMRRGTLIGAKVERLLPTFIDCGKHDLVILRVLSRYLKTALGPLAPKPMPLFVQKFGGDMATIGRGEILLPAS